MLVSGFNWHIGFLLGGGANFNFGRKKILVGFIWEYCNFLGTDLGKSSSLFELTMLDAFGLFALDSDGVSSV